MTQRHPGQHRFAVVARLAAVVLALTAVIVPTASARPETHPFEIRAGAGLSAPHDRADGSKAPYWMADNYAFGFIAAGVHVFGGLRLTAGFEGGIGSEIDWREMRTSLPTWAPGEVKKSFMETTRFGAEYELPLERYRNPPAGMDAVCFGGGLAMSRTGVHYKSQVADDPDQSTKSMRLGSITGPYVSVTGRWRLDDADADDAVDGGAGVGPYGLDLGLRYTLYTDTSGLRDELVRPDGLGDLQVFVGGFVRFRLFE